MASDVLNSKQKNDYWKIKCRRVHYLQTTSIHQNCKTSGVSGETKNSCDTIICAVALSANTSGNKHARSNSTPKYTYR